MFEANWTLFIRGEANRDEQINVANELLSILTRTINNRKGDEYNQRRTLPLASDSLKEPTDMHILLIHKYGLRVIGSIVEEIVLFGFIALFTSILFLDHIHHFVHRHILGSVGSTVPLGPFPILQWPWNSSPPHENRWRLLPWLTTERRTYISMCIAKERHQSVKWIGWFGTRRRQTIQSASWMQEAQSTQRGTTAHHWPIGDQSPLQMNVLDKISTKLSKQHPETQQGRRYDGQ